MRGAASRIRSQWPVPGQARIWRSMPRSCDMTRGALRALHSLSPRRRRAGLAPLEGQRRLQPCRRTIGTDLEQLVIRRAGAVLAVVVRARSAILGLLRKLAQRHRAINTECRRVVHVVHGNDGVWRRAGLRPVFQRSRIAEASRSTRAVLDRRPRYRTAQLIEHPGIKQVPDEVRAPWP